MKPVINCQLFRMLLRMNYCLAVRLLLLWQLEIYCKMQWNCNVSDKKATEIPSDLFSVSAESRVTVVNLSRNCLTSVPAGFVQILILMCQDTECIIYTYKSTLPAQRFYLNLFPLLVFYTILQISTSPTTCDVSFLILEH